MDFVSERRDHRLIAVGFALIALAFVAAFAFAARAQAAETLYWNNYSDNPDTIGYSNIDGSGGGALDLTGVELDGPEGMALDSVTGRLYIAAHSNGPENEGQIVYANLSGGGAGIFTAPGAPVHVPEGLTIDPATRMIYWINTENENESIAWAKLDGSAGGTLNLTGANFNGPYRLAIDPVAGRVYWGSEFEETEELVISYANVNNSGGGNLNTTGTFPTKYTNGIAVDPAGGRVYWLNEESETLSFTNINNTGGGELDTIATEWSNPYGMAVDPGAGKAYWGNYGNNEERAGAFGIASIPGGGGLGGINIATAPVAGPQDPVILKSPSGTGAPAITRSATNPAALTCSTGSWGADYPGGFVYQAPRSFGYQWLLNGVAIGGATSNALTATTAGSYTCTVTAANQSGTASQTSGAAATVKAASIKLTLKKKTAKAKAGKLATFSAKALNQGDLQGKPKLCVKLPKKAKKALKAPKCKSLTIGALKNKTTKIKIKLKPAAEGSYKIKIQVKGVPGNAVNATVKVIG